MALTDGAVRNAKPPDRDYKPADGGDFSSRSRGPAGGSGGSSTAWLANKLAPFGTVLEPGHMMLSGSFTRPVWAAKGDTLHADFGPLGTVSVQFA